MNTAGSVRIGSSKGSMRVDAEYKTPLSTVQLLRMSVRQMTRGFRISRGCSIGTCITERRVEQAKRLLVAGQHIQVIARTLGFGSPSAFCYAFRMATGSTPRAFREANFAL